MPPRAIEDAPGTARRLLLNPALLAWPLLDPAVPSGCFEDRVQSCDRAQRPRGGAEKVPTAGAKGAAKAQALGRMRAPKTSLVVRSRHCRARVDPCATRPQARGRII